MKKILFLLRYWPYFGGGETVTRLLAKEFHRRGYQIHVLYWWDRYEDRTFDGDHYISKCRLDLGEPVHDNLIAPNFYEKATLGLINYVDLNQIDYIINQWWPSFLLADNLEAIVITCHHLCLMPQLGTYNPIKKLYRLVFKKRIIAKRLAVEMDKLYEKSDAYVFLAESYKKEFIKYSKAYNKRKPVFAINNPSTYSDTTVDVCEKSKDVLFVGRIYENHKKLSRLIDSWKIVENDGRFGDYKLIIVGDGPDLNNLRDKINRYGLRNVIIVGSSNPTEYYRRASILALTSEVEGWPMTIIEAQKFGVVPIVMNNFSALSEMLSNQSGIIVNSSDSKVFAQALMDIMINDERIKVYSENCIINANLYEVSKICNEWEALFKSLEKNM